MARTAIHPGEHLDERLEALDISATELGRRQQVPGNRIVTSHRAITGHTALRLRHLFGTSPQFWLDLPAIYVLRVAEQKTGATIETLPTLTRTKNECYQARAV